MADKEMVKCSIDQRVALGINTIVFLSISSGDEMLKIARDGFYVRGVKLKQDADEARAVYDAFVSWLQTAREPKEEPKNG